MISRGNRQGWQLAVLLAVVVLLVLVSPAISLAAPITGQGGGADEANSSTMFLILGGLVALIVAAGVGLVLSRRKR